MPGGAAKLPRGQVFYRAGGGRAITAGERLGQPDVSRPPGPAKATFRFLMTELVPLQLTPETRGGLPSGSGAGRAGV